MTRWGSASLCIAIGVVLTDCSGSPKQQPPPPAQPQVMQGDFYMEMEPPQQQGSACCKEPLHRDQPPEVKLALGHYVNAKRGIGAVIDCTHKVAKVRYDGTENVLELYGQPGAYGRIDYHQNASIVLMEVYDDGRVVVFIPNSVTAAGGIDMDRDADADPL